ncbi:FecR family protein [Mucilaginibacter conchicola]|uniref:FecR family protein n=1 Tax=Mucilaginibacter conchicola TaxID=2303333 RepID=A0A372NMQ8_9SPHI|nr:FecR family protein [Mucilaginibacter conchicola]RFZ90234.1 FecR family protein [Mucilaginibacter conchicola]
MNFPDKRIQELARKLAAGNFTEAERRAFEQWYASHNDTYLEEESDETVEVLKARIFQNIKSRQAAESTAFRLRKARRLAGIAASLLIFVVIGIWLIGKRTNPSDNINAAVKIIPGGNKAILTLGNGKTIVLDSATEGRLATTSGALVIKTAEGHLAYKSNTPSVVQGEKNKISTPRGGQYWVNLADGSRVLLNAASTLTYSVSMNEPIREVELSGEAYFEVRHNAKRPFRVKVAGSVIEDIGTTFLVNSYNDEPAITATLLEGGISVSGTLNPNNFYQLKPGQQASVVAGSVSITEADTEQAAAWKEGYFMFGGETIEAVMRKIARWYDIEVIYEGALPTDRFGGTISRFESFKQVLHKLELTGRVHFTIEGRRVIVKE